MSRIILVVGLPDSKPNSKPSLVYLGRSGEEMRQAIASAVFPRLVIAHHVAGVPKNNPNAAANAANAAAREKPAQPNQPPAGKKK